MKGWTETLRWFDEVIGFWQCLLITIRAVSVAHTIRLYARKTCVVESTTVIETTNFNRSGKIKRKVLRFVFMNPCWGLYAHKLCWVYVLYRAIRKRRSIHEIRNLPLCASGWAIVCAQQLVVLCIVFFSEPICAAIVQWHWWKLTIHLFRIISYQHAARHIKQNLLLLT